MTIKKVALLATALMVISFSGAQPVQALDTVKIRLNWFLQGSHGAFILGRDRGYFAQEGIELVVNEGRGSMRSVQLVGARADDFAMADAGSLIAGASKGIPAQAVMSLINVSAYAIVSLKSRGINKAGDLKGKSLAVTAGDGLTQLWPAMMAANGLKPDQVRIVMMDAAAKPVSVMKGQTDALLGGFSDQPNLIRSKGLTVSVLPFSDAGVNHVGTVIVAHRDTIAQKPDLVRRFVKATQRSYEAMRKDPQAAVTAIKREKSDLNNSVVLAQINDTLQLMAKGQAAGKPIGFGPALAWQQTLTLGQKYQGLKTKMASTDFYTNGFLGQ